ncbi:YbcC family protein [Raineya sp.]|jgi:hypothetical protein
MEEKKESSLFEEKSVLEHIRHYLPHQNPLKDFIHQNSLSSFQDKPFHYALRLASQNFGYKVYLSLNEYRDLYEKGKISPDILRTIIVEKKGSQYWKEWQEKLLKEPIRENWKGKIGKMYSLWYECYHIDMQDEVHSFLLRLVSAYTDQGVAFQKFPIVEKTFLDAIKEIEKEAIFKTFYSSRVRNILLNSHFTIKKLLDILVGDEKYYEQYLFEQQFAHPGWSGMIALLEKHPESLFDKRKISLHDFIFIELLLEIDALDKKFGEGKWQSMAHKCSEKLSEVSPLLPFRVEFDEMFEVLELWQEAYEWSFYDQVLKGLQIAPQKEEKKDKYSFQGIFCIDDRCCSIRRYVEKFCNAQTFGTAGFFNFEFYFQPEHSRFYTKSCPAPVEPKYLIKETETRKRHHDKDIHFHRNTKNLFGGWIISQTLGFWSALQMAWNILKPSQTPAMVSSFRHLDPNSKLSLQFNPERSKRIHHLQVGFNLDELAERLESLFMGMGLTKDFCNLVYIIGHGSSSVNNTHYAGYDCGACSGKVGSVNARVAALAANKPEVRAILKKRGIIIPETTQFLGALHDTTRDEIWFYDEHILKGKNKILHEENKKNFQVALAYNAKERARRFLNIHINEKAEKVHQKVKLRSLSLFEPRPEWNHATNALCIVGKREDNKHLFLDRRSFLNSYDYSQDLDGKHLLVILKAVAPVCGGINLEYYFSKVDRYRLGAGSKLPHNVIGLIGVGNGIEGDLRTGLPEQMLNIHEPLRLLVVVEHFPDVVDRVIRQDEKTFEWFANEWIHLVVLQPENKRLYRFCKNAWQEYVPLTSFLPTIDNLDKLFENQRETIPVSLIK